MDPNFATNVFVTLVNPYDVTNAVIGLAIPLIVSLVTNKAANPNLKAAIMFVLAAIASVIMTALSAVPPGLGWSAFLAALGTTLTAAVVAHFGFWKKGLGDFLSKYGAQIGVGANNRGSRSEGLPAPGLKQDPGGNE